MKKIGFLKPPKLCKIDIMSPAMKSNEEPE
jgi:hypothetical protein